MRGNGDELERRHPLQLLRRLRARVRVPEVVKDATFSNALPAVRETGRGGEGRGGELVVATREGQKQNKAPEARTR